MIPHQTETTQTVPHATEHICMDARVEKGSLTIGLWYQNVSSTCLHFDKIGLLLETF